MGENSWGESGSVCSESIIYRKQEIERNEIPFLCLSKFRSIAKILWKGEAIKVYSVKPTGEYF